MGNQSPSTPKRHQKAQRGSGEIRPSTAKATTVDQNESLQCAVSSMKGWRPTMEDQHLMRLGLYVTEHGIKISLKDHSLFAVFDGHGGTFTSRFLHNHFVHCFSEQPALAQYLKLGAGSRASVPGVSLLKKSLKQTFLDLDDALREAQVQRLHMQENSNRSELSSDTVPTERSGSTAVVVLLTPSHILTANAGDSRAMLRRHGKAEALSFDHKPSNVPERLRIQVNGGFVKHKRVNGDLAVSRAFGDFLYKKKRLVIVDPDIVVFPRDQAGDEFIVLACDGVWDVATNQVCSQFVQTLLSEGEVNLGNICEEGLDICFDRKSRDNMTFMLVGLPGMKADTSRHAVLNNALWGQRTSRQVQELAQGAVQTTEDAFSAITRELSRTLLRRNTLSAF